MSFEANNGFGEERSMSTNTIDGAAQCVLKMLRYNTDEFDVSLTDRVGECEVGKRSTFENFIL